MTRSSMISSFRWSRASGQDAVSSTTKPPLLMRRRRRKSRVEFRRRARIGAGAFQSIGVLWPLMDPRKGAIAFTFISHKLFRWLCPFFLLGVVVANIVLVNNGIYGVALVGWNRDERRCAHWPVCLARFIGRARPAADDDVCDDERRAAGRVFPLGNGPPAGRMGTDGAIGNAVRLPPAVHHAHLCQAG